VSLRVSALCGLLAQVTFIVGWLAGGLAQPGAYSFVRDDISDLGAPTADRAWIYNQIGANLTGLLMVGFALGLWRALGPHRFARLGAVALVVMGTGQFLDGLLRVDCREIDSGCSDRDSVSWRQNAHGIETAFTIVSFTLAPFVLAWAFRRLPEWRDLWLPTLLAGIATLVAVLIAFGASGVSGLGLRGATAIWFAWIGLLAFRLLRIPQPRSSLPARGVQARPS